MTLTQKDTVLRVLRDSGAEGVRSDVFLSLGIPRAAARVLELRGEGYEISSTREKQFTRYCLVGVGAEGVASRKESLLETSVVDSADSSKASTLHLAPSEPEPTVRLVEPSEGALFVLPPLNAFTDPEAA